MHAVLAAFGLTTLLAAPARAQETVIPAASGVIALTSQGACPDVPETHRPELVATSVGLARHVGDGVYAHTCPDRWQGPGDAVVAASPDAQQQLVVHGGSAWLSTNGGCQFSVRPVPDEGVAHDAVYWRSSFWLLATTSEETALLRWDATEWTRITGWTDFAPTHLLPEEGDEIWLVAADPVVEIRRLGVGAGLRDDGPLPNVPTVQGPIDDIVPVATFDREIWFRVERGPTSWLWWAEVIEGNAQTVVTFADLQQATSGRIVNGPARLGAEWVLTVDGAIFTAQPGVGNVVATGSSASLTCLTQVGDRVFGCTVPELLAITQLTDDGFVTTPVFSFAQLQPPLEACDVSAACQAEWDEVAASIGYVPDAEPAVCPDGRTLSEVDPTGCACASRGAPGGPGAAWAAALAALLIAAGRRRPRTSAA